MNVTTQTLKTALYCVGIHGTTGQQIDEGNLPAGTEVRFEREEEGWEVTWVYFLSLQGGRWFRQRADKESWEAAL